jgi:hypothetical protein
MNNSYDTVNLKNVGNDSKQSQNSEICHIINETNIKICAAILNFGYKFPHSNSGKIHANLKALWQ